MLLQYVADQSKKRAQTSDENGDDEDDKDVKYVRKWYAPWKKVKVGGAAFKVGLCVEKFSLLMLLVLEP